MPVIHQNTADKPRTKMAKNYLELHLGYDLENSMMILEETVEKMQDHLEGEIERLAARVEVLETRARYPPGETRVTDSESDSPGLEAPRVIASHYGEFCVLPLHGIADNEQPLATVGAPIEIGIRSHETPEGFEDLCWEGADSTWTSRTVRLKQLTPLILVGLSLESSCLVTRRAFKNGSPTQCLTGAIKYS
jgi:hypothetical protein